MGSSFVTLAYRSSLFFFCVFLLLCTFLYFLVVFQYRDRWDRWCRYKIGIRSRARYARGRDFTICLLPNTKISLTLRPQTLTLLPMGSPHGCPATPRKRGKEKAMIVSETIQSETKAGILNAAIYRSHQTSFIVCLMKATVSWHLSRLSPRETMCQWPIRDLKQAYHRV